MTEKPFTCGQTDMTVLVRAAQAADYATRPMGRNWSRVNDDQAARLIAGAMAPLEAERDELRKLLDEIGVTAAGAPEDGDSFSLLEEIAMRIAAAGVPDSTPIEEWPDPENPVTGRTPGAAAESARDALDAQSLHDSPGEDM